LEEYNFYEGIPSAAYSADFEVALFNKYQHLYLQSEEGWYTFYAANEKYKSIACCMHVHVSERDARSPLRSSFGGIECSDEVPPVILFRFLEFIEEKLKEKGVANLIIKNPPQYYNPKRAALTETLLFNLGYSVIDAELGTVVEVKEEFGKHADLWERRKLRQAREAGFFFRAVPNEMLNDVYFFILACRKQKGYSLSMNLADLRETASRFPDQHILSAVYQEEKMIAASIAIRVHQDVLYNFYSDHDKQYDVYSPIVLLMEGLHNYCMTNRIPLLDLGTSAVNGKPNFGLLDFKMRLGGVPTSKLTFKKDW
jgi:hypothetical protein